MRHLVIKNIGPIKSADISLKKVNIIIGQQSSGKSCILKIACYCTWVEKRIVLTQKSDFFSQDGNFINELVRFHKLKGYIRPDAYISYESDFMSFTYDHRIKKFSFEWKKDRWNYIRSKVTYIPAERNMVAAIPNWFDIKLPDDNIRSFMSDWELARKAVTEKLPVLDLGVYYHYDSSANVDRVEVAKGIELDFTNTSSGLQSLIPLYVHLYYLNYLQYKEEKNESVLGLYENMQLIHNIYKEKFTASSADKGNLLFASQEELNKFNDVYNRYTNNHYCDIYLEEPEANLFPPTQVQLVHWLKSMSEGEHASNLFIATHSPYVVTGFLEHEDENLALFFLSSVEEGLSVVKTASAQDIQEIYDYGVDAFFNLETFA